MVEGLTASAAHPGADADVLGRDAVVCRAWILRDRGSRRLECADAFDGASPANRTGRVHNVRILVTQAERPHPFPSRTRKLSSPAPKILRGQPLGKIGRRRDLLRCRRARSRPAPRAAGVDAGPVVRVNGCGLTWSGRSSTWASRRSAVLGAYHPRRAAGRARRREGMARRPG